MAGLDLRISTDDEEVKLMCELYWELASEDKFSHTVTEVADAFKITSSELLKAVSEHCKAVSLAGSCAGCGGRWAYSKRSEYQNRPRGSNVICGNCAAKERQERELKVKEENDKRIQAIEERYAVKATPELDIRELSLEQAVFLLSFIRLAATEELVAYKAFDLIQGALAPTFEFCMAIIRKLFHDDLIEVHPGSPLNAFDFESGSPDSIYLNKVWWAIPSALTAEKGRALIARFDNAFEPENWQPEWNDQAKELWAKLAMYECLELLKESLEAHSLSFNPGEKTRAVLSLGLNRFSAGQMYNFIWRAAKDAAAYYQRGGISKPQAANTVVGSIERQIDRASGESWDVKAFGRDRNCPQTMVSQVLFSVVLRGPDGFSQPPTEASLLNYPALII